MNNPILVLIFWGVINLFIKSARDKKRAEQARNKRSFQGNMGPQRSKPQSTKSLIDVFKEELEKEVRKEKENQSKKTKPYIQEIKEKHITQPAQKVSIVNDELIEEKDEMVNIIHQSSNTDKPSGKKLILNNTNELLKGIIYSEILSQPKGIRNSKR